METELKIGFWNINSLSEKKISDEAFKAEINRYQIKICSGSKLGKFPWVIKVTLILPVYIIAQKTLHTLKKMNAMFSSL